jgi:creatinine amidohydrolase/Fe(II)-dependent formamide hydrolase-like protein
MNDGTPLGGGGLDYNKPYMAAVLISPHHQNNNNIRHTTRYTKKKKKLLKIKVFCYVMEQRKMQILVDVWNDRTSFIFQGQVVLTNLLNVGNYLPVDMA